MSAETRVLELAAGPATTVVDLDNGCRLTSLRIFGRELLVRSGRSPLHWGSFPMAPFAGRVRQGRFHFAGTDYELPPNLGEHAIHGNVFMRPWQVEGDGWFGIDLGDPWPLPGRVRQRVELAADALALTLEVHSAGGSMPASCGWHPWFRKQVAAATAALDLEAGYMEVRGPDAIPTGERVPPPPGPWDDLFGDLARPPVLRWPGELELEVDTSCGFFVVYDEEPEAICVEPQTAPNDALNRDPFVVTPDQPLRATTTWRWKEDPGGQS